MKKKKELVLHYTILSVLAFMFLLPLVMVFLFSLRETSEFYTDLNLFSLPKTLDLGNFIRAWTKGKLFRYMFNGFIVCLIKVPLGVLITSACAYALTKTNLKHATGIFVFILVGMMLPRQMSLIPLNVMFSNLKLNNTYFSLIVTYLGVGVPTGVLVFRGFFRSMPIELNDAARIDGCNDFQIYTKIIMPNAKPAIATMFTLDFLYTWNEFLVQSVLITKDSMKTVPFGLLTFIGEYSTDYGLLSAGVLISIIPVFIMFLIFQKYFVEGMAGAVKG